MLKSLVTAALSAAFAFAFGSVAAHADGYKAAPKAAPAYEKPACAQFGGFYVGAHAGSAYHDWRWQDRDITFGALSTESSTSGLIGGAQVGYNVQRGCTVFGVEADWTWADLDSSKDFRLLGGLGGISGTVRGGTDWFGTLRTRGGIVVDNLMLYVTGGLAYADFNRAWDLNVGAANIASFRHDDTRWGWVAGFGTEYAISDRISLRSEALYIRFEDETSSHALGGIGAVLGNLRFDHNDSLWVGRIGLNIKLGGHRESYESLK